MVNTLPWTLEAIANVGNSKNCCTLCITSSTHSSLSSILRSLKIILGKSMKTTSLVLLKKEYNNTSPITTTKHKWSLPRMYGGRETNICFFVSQRLLSSEKWPYRGAVAQFFLNCFFERLQCELGMAENEWKFTIYHAIWVSAPHSLWPSMIGSKYWLPVSTLIYI